MTAPPMTFDCWSTALTTISDAGSTITIYGGDPEGLDTDNLTINSGATVSLNSQTVQGNAILQVDGGTGTGLLDLNTVERSRATG